MSNTLVESMVADELRGRVMSIFAVASLGMHPLGALLLGGMAEMLGAPISVAFGAIVTLGFMLWLFFRVPRIRAL
jgi:hypothetical protein